MGEVKDAYKNLLAGMYAVENQDDYDDYFVYIPAPQLGPIAQNIAPRWWTKLNQGALKRKRKAGAYRNFYFQGFKRRKRQSPAAYILNDDWMVNLKCETATADEEK